MGTRKNPTRHGLTGTDIYRIYRGIKFRCTNTKDYRAKYYVKKGILMCDEWLNNPKSFCDWAITNGYKKGLTIDRIDNNKGYSPDNCRFVTIKEQCNNRSNNRWVTIGNETKTIAQWSEKSGIGQATIRRNIEKGYTGIDVLKPEAFHMTFSKIAQYDLNGNLIKIWDNIRQACIANNWRNGRSANSIAKCCKHLPSYKTAYGYRWEYYKD